MPIQGHGSVPRGTSSQFTDAGSSAAGLGRINEAIHLSLCLQPRDIAFNGVLVDFPQQFDGL